MVRAQKISIPALALVAAFASGPLSAQETTLVILDFDLSGVTELGPDSGVLLRELLTVEIPRRSTLQVLDRLHIEDLRREYSRDLSGQTTREDIVRSGRLAGAQFLVSGRGFSLDGKLTMSANLTAIETGFVTSIVYEDDAKKRLTDVAAKLALSIRAALEAAKAHQRDGLQRGETQRGSRPVISTGRPPAPLPRLRISLSETMLETPSKSSLVEGRLGNSLSEKGFPSPTGDAPADLLLLGEARATPGRRTGDLISARAYLKINVYDLRKREIIETLEVEATGEAVSVDAAARNALRNVADATVELVLPYLVE